MASSKRLVQLGAAALRRFNSKGFPARADRFSHSSTESGRLSEKILGASFEKLPCNGLGKELPAYWGKPLGYQLISRGYLTEANRDGYKFVSDSSKGVQFQPVLNNEEQRITSSGEVGKLNGLAPLENEFLSEAQLYKKHFGERMKMAMPVGLAPFAMCSNIDGVSQVSAMSALDVSVQSSALLLNMALFWHVKEGMREILADYVHQEITREWITIFLRLFLLIVVKDLFFLL